MLGYYPRLLWVAAKYRPPAFQARIEGRALVTSAPKEMPRPYSHVPPARDDVWRRGDMLISICIYMYVPGPPKVPKIMAQYPKIESMGSIGSTLLGILEVQVHIYIYIGVIYNKSYKSIGYSEIPLNFEYGAKMLRTPSTPYSRSKSPFLLPSNHSPVLWPPGLV